MKVVKLDNRHNVYKKLGHTTALRFTSWTFSPASAVERIVVNTLGYQTEDPRWFAYFGKQNGRNKYKPFWISFKYPADLSMILLKLDQKR
jgi:hypothetical protein